MPKTTASARKNAIEYGMCVWGIGTTPMLARPLGNPPIVSVGRIPWAIPRYSVRVPIVTASDGRPRRVTKKPFSAPRKAPSTTAMIIAGQIGQPCLKSSAMSTPLRPSMDATERSISPVTTIKVSGSAMIATSPTFKQM
jgi:hypothetical protein